MILQALIEYYTRLEADPSEDVAPFGFARLGIHYCIVLRPDGSLCAIQPLREEAAGRNVPVSKMMAVPHPGGKRTSNIKPYFLWDKSSYVFGRDFAEENKGDPITQEETRKRLREQFDAFRDLHLSQRQRITHPAFHALCSFVESWSPDDADSLPNWKELSGANLVFRLERERQYVHEIPECRDAWLDMLASEGSRVGICLLTNRLVPIARTHPPIKGVIDPGGQAEKSFVAFNLDKTAFSHFGKEQGYNAPIGIEASFRYATALNRLLAESQRRIQICDATLVYWSSQPTPFEDVFGTIVAESEAEDPQVNDRVRAFLERGKQGRTGDDLSDADTPFFVLGLSPNGPRLSVRFWVAGTVREMADRLVQHVADMEITGARPDDPPLVTRRLLLETARPKKGKPDPETIAPLLAGAVTRAVLTGAPYPDALYSAVIRRIRADARVNHRRAAILKAYLVRRARLAGQTLEVPMSLNTSHPDPAYHLGRLFAALEKTQEDALGGNLNRTIKDAYFSSASATPGAVFPRLMRLSQHHIEKLEGGLRIYREKLIQEIMSHLQRFPTHLSLDKQGLFHIAYYHQRQAFFDKKEPVQLETEE